METEERKVCVCGEGQWKEEMERDELIYNIFAIYISDVNHREYKKMED